MVRMVDPATANSCEYILIRCEEAYLPVQRRSSMELELIRDVTLRGAAASSRGSGVHKRQADAYFSGERF